METGLFDVVRDVLHFTFGVWGEADIDKRNLEKLRCPAVHNGIFSSDQCARFVVVFFVSND